MIIYPFYDRALHQYSRKEVFYVDKSAIEKAIRHFEFNASPASSFSSDPVTVVYVKKLIHEISKLALAIADSEN